MVGWHAESSTLILRKKNGTKDGKIRNNIRMAEEVNAFHIRENENEIVMFDVSAVSIALICFSYYSFFFFVFH